MIVGVPDPGITWQVVKVGNLIYEQHERDDLLFEHKLFGDPTITVISGDQTILVDPGYGYYRQERLGIDERADQEDGLRWYLAMAGLEVADIEIVFLTHRHLDHTNLTGLFRDAGARVLTGPDIGEDGDEVMAGVSILHVPGHLPDAYALSFESLPLQDRKEIKDPTAALRVVVAGDAVVSLDYFRELAPYWKNRYSTKRIADTRQSMRRISGLADVIVPGHGQPFINSPVIRDRWPQSVASQRQ